MKVKNVVITGGTRGIGLTYARHLAKLGYDLVLSDISSGACQVYGEATSVESILTELRGSGVKAFFVAADLTDTSACEALVTEAVRLLGTIDAFVANAGGDISGDDDQAAGGKAPNNHFLIDQAEHENIFKRNFDTCYLSLRAVVPYFKQRGYGKIVTISSVNAAVGVAKETSYATAKAAVVHLTRCLATELRADGINVNCLMPGPTKSGRFMSTLKGRNPHDLVGIESTARLNRVAAPADIAPVLEFLLSPASDFISGQVLRVDGGLFCQPV